MVDINRLLSSAEDYIVLFEQQMRKGTSKIEMFENARLRYGEI